MSPSRTAAVAVLALRVAYGATLAAVPASITKRWLGAGRYGAATQVALRGLGAREILLHVGGLAAALRDEPVRPWLAASIAGDLADIAATVAGRRGLPEKAPLATAAVAGGSALISAAVAAGLDA